MLNAILVMVAVVVVFLVTFFVLNPKAAGRIGFLGKSKLGRIGRAAEGADPIGQMRQAADDAADKIVAAREALVRAEGAKAALGRQVEADRREVSVLTARINRLLDQGESPDSPKVRELADDLGRARKYLVDNERQLADNERLCTEALEVIKRENDKVLDLEREADQLEVRLDVSNAQAAVAGVADILQPGRVHMTLHGAASKFREIAQKQIDENNARMRVFSALGGRESEEAAGSADGEAALDEILAARKNSAA